MKKNKVWLLFTLIFLPLVSPAKLCSQRPNQTQVGTLQSPDLAEASGMRFSVLNPQLIFHIADGSKPQLFVTDRQGRKAKSIPLQVTLEDTEALTLAPCQGETCVVVGDIGDNARTRSTIQLHYFRESKLLSSRGPVAPDLSVSLKYPSNQGSQNAEALWTDPRGQIFLFTKVKGSAVSQLYAVDARSSQLRWVRSLDFLALPNRLPLDPIKKKNGFMISDADFNYQDQTLAVVTYQYIFEFQWASLNKPEPQMRLGEDFVVRALDQALQYEGIAYLPHSKTLYVTNEMEARRNLAPLWVFECLSFF